jgi:transcription elongation factor GreA
MMTQQTYLTPEGLAKLEAELEELRTVRRLDVAARIQRAKEIGGTVDNAEYDEAKNDQAFIEGRILTLEAMVKNVVIIEQHKTSSTVLVGSRVTVVDDKNNERDYTIVGSQETDPAQNRISNVSPIGKALLGKRVGQVAEVHVPAGRIRLKIKKIG